MVISCGVVTAKEQLLLCREHQPLIPRREDPVLPRLSLRLGKGTGLLSCAGLALPLTNTIWACRHFGMVAASWCPGSHSWSQIQLLFQRCVTSMMACRYLMGTSLASTHLGMSESSLPLPLGMITPLGPQATSGSWPVTASDGQCEDFFTPSL